jgi:hypothetical protein
MRVFQPVALSAADATATNKLFFSGDFGKIAQERK